MTPDAAPLDDLSRLLDTYASSAILAMCAFHGVAAKPAHQKAPMVAVLAKVLPERDRVSAQWQKLSPAERALVVGILQRGGQASTRALHDELVRLSLVDKVSQPVLDVFRRPRPPDPRAANSRRFEDVLSRLTLRGLVFAAAPPDGPYPQSPGREPSRNDFYRLPPVVFIPESIRRHLPAQLPPEAKPTAAVNVAAVAESSARVCQRDLYLYWSYARRHPVRITQKDEAQKSDLKKINATLLLRETLGKGEGEFDHPRLRFVRQLLMALGLLTDSDSGSLAAQVLPDDFFAAAPAERVRRSYEAWLPNVYFNELLLVKPARLEFSLFSAPDLVIRARQTVVAAVQSAARRAAGDWTAFGALCDLVRETNYEFLFRRALLGPSYYAYAPMHPYTPETNPLRLSFPAVRTEEEGWQVVEANFIRSVVAGPLFWLGLADLGRTQADLPEQASDAFRLTALGQWVLGLGPRPEIPADGGRVIVQPNMHIVALDPVNDATLANLDRFAERLTAERAVEYQLTRASVYAGQRAGWDVTRVKTFLQQQIGEDLPGNVARTLDEWQVQHERIVFHPQVALAHGPAHLFDALAQDTSDFAAGRPVPEVLLLKNAQAAPGFVAALQAHDILPLRSEHAAISPNAVQADANGAIRFTAHRPNLYLHGHLAAFADPDSSGGYQITAETVMRAQRAGLSALDILARLAVVHRGPVPELLVRRVRAWAKHFGSAALEQVTLLQFRDANTLAELSSDPELAPFLSPFGPPRQKALARIRSADAEKVRALLVERGVDVEDHLESGDRE